MSKHSNDDENILPHELAQLEQASVPVESLEELWALQAAERLETQRHELSQAQSGLKRTNNGYKENEGADRTSPKSTGKAAADFGEIATYADYARLDNQFYSSPFADQHTKLSWNGQDVDVKQSDVYELFKTISRNSEGDDKLAADSILKDISENGVTPETSAEITQFFEERPEWQPLFEDFLADQAAAANTTENGLAEHRGDILSDRQLNTSEEQFDHRLENTLGDDVFEEAGSFEAYKASMADETTGSNMTEAFNNHASQTQNAIIEIAPEAPHASQEPETPTTAAPALSSP